MSSVRIVLLGAGAVSRLFYLPTLRELTRHGILRVVAVVDPIPASRDSLARELGATPCDTFAAALADPALQADLAIVATPPRFHRAQTEEAFAAGLDVLCEKPLAPTSVDCAAMVEAAERQGRLLAAGHYKRFMPAHRAIKALIEQKTFGELLHIEIAEGGKFSWPAATDSFFRKEQTPGGVLLDIGVHVLDLLHWWLGRPTAFTYADDAIDGLEANSLLEATFANGATATVRLSRDWPTANCHCLRFERATLHCRVNASNQLELTLAGLPMTFAAELRDPLPARPAERTEPLETNAQSFIAQLADVCAAVRERRAPTVTGASAQHAVRWIEECYATRTPLEVAAAATAKNFEILKR